MNNVERLTFESQPLRSLGRSQRKRAQGSSVKTIEERNEFFATGGVHCQLQRSLDSFRAAVCEMRSRRRLNGNYLIEFFCQRRHVTIVIISTAHVDQLFSLLLNRAYDLGMAVTSRANRHAGVAIKENISV